MQVRFRKYYMPRHDKTCRETDSKGNDPRRDFRGNIDRPVYIEVLFMNNEIVCQVFNKDVQYSIGAATRQVTEGLGRDKPCHRFMTKVYSPNYYMSEKSKQSGGLTTKLLKNTEYMTTPGLCGLNSKQQLMRYIRSDL